jgi:hypothetical protein
VQDFFRDDFIRANATAHCEAALTKLKYAPSYPQLDIAAGTIGWLDEDIVKNLHRKFSPSDPILCFPRELLLM